jgi:signal transduction histidine kinase
MDEDGRQRGAVGAFVDITDRKKAIDALKQSQDDLNRAQVVARVGSWRLELPSEELLWSDENYIIFGVPPATPMTYEKFLSIVHPDDRGYVEMKWTAAMKGEAYDIEHRIVANGDVRWVREKAVLECSDGIVKSGFGTTQDITEKKNAEEELKRSNAELQQFAYVASHDLQEPLRMVMSYLALLNKKYANELDPKAKEYIAFVNTGAERMRQLVNDLLQYSRIDTQGKELAPVDLNKVVEVVMNDLHVAINEANAEVVVGPLPTVMADESQMKQVLTNLISNAVKFRSSEPPIVEVRALNHGDVFVFAVKDNGIGIDPKYYDNLFKMFQRLHTKDEYPGTGIGLAISKKIVERHGGRIWVESELGKGATFYFSIPGGLSKSR